MTADFAIYAAGGGLGHHFRGITLKERLERQGYSVLLHTRLAPVLYQEWKAKRLIVDTFPLGWRDELSEDWLRVFPHRILLARYSRDLDPRIVNSAYDEVWSPYSEELDEWRGSPIPSLIPQWTKIGLLLRTDPLILTRKQGLLLLVDPERRSSQDFVERAYALAREAGYDFELSTGYQDRLGAEKFLFIGCGYNTFYETLGQNADCRFVPVLKRHDDQEKRARLQNRCIKSFREYESWLNAELPSGCSEALEPVSSVPQRGAGPCPEPIPPG